MAERNANPEKRGAAGSALARAWRRIFGWLREDGRTEPSRRNLLRSEGGGSLIEFAVTIPVMLSFTFGLMELCIACYTHEMISEVAREATRYAIVHGSTCTTGAGASCTASVSSVNAYAQATGLPNLGGGTMTPATSYPDGGAAPGDRVQVNVTYQFPISVPFVPKSTLTMSTTSTMYIIQ